MSSALLLNDCNDNVAFFTTLMELDEVANSLNPREALFVFFLSWPYAVVF